MTKLTDEEWREFDRLTDKRDLTDGEMTRWVDLETRARGFFQTQDQNKNPDWEEFSGLFDKRPNLTADEFKRYIELEDRILSTEVMERMSAAFEAKKRGLVSKTFFGTIGLLFAILFVQIGILGFDGQRRRAKESKMEAKIAAMFPGTKPECIAWPRARLPVLDVTTSVEYSCDYRSGKGPSGIDFIRIDDAGAAVAYRTIMKPVEQAVDSEEVSRFTVDMR